MNIIIAINNDYLEMCKTMLFSLLRHNKQHKIVIHILNHNLSENKLDNLKKFIQENGGVSKVYMIDESLFENVSRVLARFSIEMFFRIIAYKILPISIDRALWLDSDLIVKGDISKFYYQKFEDKKIVACRDVYYKSEFIGKIKNKMDLPSEHDYFNSGVILFNFTAIRKNLCEEQIIEVISRYNEKLTYPDQDILNKLFSGEIKYCDENIYNFQVNETYRAELSRTLILHYAGERKPWLVKKTYPISWEWWKERIKMGDYRGFINYSVIYYLLYIPKMIKRSIRNAH